MTSTTTPEGGSGGTGSPGTGSPAGVGTDTRSSASTLSLSSRMYRTRTG